MADREGLVIDGLNVNDGVYTLESFSNPPPEPRIEWLEGDHGAIPADPVERFENRRPVARVRIDAASKDAALTAIRAITAKFRKAARRHRQGLSPIVAVWTPDSGTFVGHLQVIRGRLTNLPIEMSGDLAGWFVQAPVVEFELECEPAMLHPSEVTGPGGTLTSPVGSIEIPDVPGDLPALTRIRLTDSQVQSRAFVAWGLEAEDYVSGSAVVIDSDSLVTSGLAGSQTTRTGAYDSPASGNNVIRATLGTVPVVVCRTADLGHIGRYLVRPRVYASAADVYLRAAYRSGDGPWIRRPWIPIELAAQWLEPNLREIVAQRVKTGTQRTLIQIEAYSTTPGATIDVDYLGLTPTSHGSGVARAPEVDLTAADTFAVRDSFDQSAGSLTGKSLPVPSGQSWARITGSSDDADDFTIDATNHVASRVALSDGAFPAGRFGIAGTSNYSDVEVRATVKMTPTAANGGSQVLGVFARLANIDNFLLAMATTSGFGPGSSTVIGLLKRVGGVTTPLPVGGINLGRGLLGGGLRIRLSVVRGRYRMYAWAVGAPEPKEPQISGYDSDLAVGGGLASAGRVGIFDHCPAASNGGTRTYDDFEAAAIPTEFALYSSRRLEFRTDDTEREASGGTHWGRPPIYRGHRPMLQPAGSEGVVNRLAITARRTDIEDGLPANDVTDQVVANVFYRPRYLEVPAS